MVRMNFAGEMKAFNDWLKADYLPPLSQLLWFKLMLRNNECMWSEWFVVKNQDLMAMIGVSSEKTAIAARDKLIEKGLLEYRKGKKGSPNKYHIIPLYCRYYSVYDSESYSTNAVNPTVQPAVIYKLNKTDYYDDGDDDAPARRESLDDDVTPQGLFAEYFGIRPTPKQVALCNVWLERSGGELVERAFMQACKAGILRLDYVGSILENCNIRGVKDLGDAAEDDMRHQRKWR